jgi:hypothetical protein
MRASLLAGLTRVFEGLCLVRLFDGAGPLAAFMARLCLGCRRVLSVSVHGVSGSGVRRARLDGGVGHA